MSLSLDQPTNNANLRRICTEESKILKLIGAMYKKAILTKVVKINLCRFSFGYSQCACFFQVSVSFFSCCPFVIFKVLVFFLSCRLPAGLIDSWLRFKPDVSLFPADSISVRTANRAHNSSTRLRIGWVACLIRSSTDLRGSSSEDVSVTALSISGKCLNLSSIVSGKLSSVWVPFSVSSFTY